MKNFKFNATIFPVPALAVLTGCAGLSPCALYAFSAAFLLLFGTYTIILLYLIRRNRKSAALIEYLERIISRKTGYINHADAVMEDRKNVIHGGWDYADKTAGGETIHEDKSDLMILNSRQASLGEMIGFIGHQWKQNIYAISLYTEAMKNILKQKGVLDSETAREPLEKIDSFIIEMYNNMNDFADFIKPEKEIEYFSIADAVEETLKLMGDFITINSVEVIKDFRGGVPLTGFSNEMKQVVMNIIKNAIDAFTERDISDRVIVITIDSNDEMNLVSIRDNAGGIPFDDPDVVFEKFCTSKADGTGIGLYLSRMIIEQRFGGKINVHNTEGGASFVISIPVFTEDTVL